MRGLIQHSWKKTPFKSFCSTLGQSKVVVAAYKLCG